MASPPFARRTFSQTVGTAFDRCRRALDSWLHRLEMSSFSPHSEMSPPPFFGDPSPKAPKEVKQRYGFFDVSVPL